MRTYMQLFNKDARLFRIIKATLFLMASYAQFLASYEAYSNRFAKKINTDTLTRAFTDT